ncbi:MAG: nucleotidyltransferase domain-containing protein [Pseudomonadota bacterium]
MQTVYSICSEHRAVLAVYIFGSFSKGTGRRPNDIDLAVLLDDECSNSFSILSLISSLEKALGCPVDVVVLNRAGELLKYEIRRSGKLVFERSPEARKRFEMRGRKTYEDFLYLHKRYVNRVLYGAKNG